MRTVAPAQSESVRLAVLEAVDRAKVTDMHTHLYSPHFGPLLLWGIDEMLTYHYLVAEAMRWVDVPYDDFWKLPKRRQADLVWQALFIDHCPISEACRGLLTSLAALGLDVSSRKLDDYRTYFAGQNIVDHTARVLDLAGIDRVVMTNDPFDDVERDYWHAGSKPDFRFQAALRLDLLLNNWEIASGKLRDWGYGVETDLGGRTLSEVRRFLGDWIVRMRAVYVAVSLPPTFAFPEDSARGRLIAECVVPVTGERDIPIALMIGVKRSVNPALRLAGDGVGHGSIEAVENLCRSFSESRFLITMLSRENQYELCVAARKFRNLMPFGCWWYLNSPSLVDEITRMRLELLGQSVIPQHSDARVLEQVIYKWAHSKEIIGKILVEKYLDLAVTGWNVSKEEIQKDVLALFRGNFQRFAGGPDRDRPLPQTDAR